MSIGKLNLIRYEVAKALHEAIETKAYFSWHRATFRWPFYSKGDIMR